MSLEMSSKHQSLVQSLKSRANIKSSVKTCVKRGRNLFSSCSKRVLLNDVLPLLAWELRVNTYFCFLNTVSLLK